MLSLVRLVCAPLGLFLWLQLYHIAHVGLRAAIELSGYRDLPFSRIIIILSRKRTSFVVMLQTCQVQCVRLVAKNV